LMAVRIVAKWKSDFVYGSPHARGLCDCQLWRRTDVTRSMTLFFAAVGGTPPSCGAREGVPPPCSAVMSCMLPTATLRCACCAAFILPNITALLLLVGCISSQWQRRQTAIAKQHKAVARFSQAARSCAPALRCTLWPPRLTAGLLLGGYGSGRLPGHTSIAGPANSAVTHSGQSLRSCRRHITAFGMRWLVASVSVRGAGAPRTSTTDCIDPAACDRKCFRPPPIQLPAGQCRSPTLRGRAGTPSKCAALPYGYGVPSPASLVVAPNHPSRFASCWTQL